MTPDEAGLRRGLAHLIPFGVVGWLVVAEVTALVARLVGS